MPTEVAQKPRAFFATDNRPSTTFTGHPIDYQTDGSAIVRGVEVFKVGTFRDSWGDQHTWLAEHLAQMVANFNLLKSNGIFPNVPTRRDHSLSIDKVMGYIDTLVFDGSKLLADIHVTEPTEVDKLARGTYRSVSLEVGMYVDNNEAAFWPVVFGVAYVDIPAVEGLHNKSKEISYFSQIPQGEGTMSGTQNGTGTQVDDRPPQTVINIHGASATGEPVVNASPAPAAPAASAPPAAAPAAAPATAPTAGAATFRINGQDTVDFAAVQRHIDALELVVTTTDQDNRKAFVTGLASEGKIVAAQTEAMQTFALSLTADAYKAWTGTFASAQKLPLLQQHGGNPTPDAGAGENDADDQITILSETVATLHRIWPKEKVEKTEAFRKLTALTATKS